MSKTKDVVHSLLRARRYIEENYQDSLLLNDIAKVSHLSTFHFHRLFKAYFNFTPQDYQTHIKLERGAHLLLQTSFPLADIAFEVGYENLETFVRNFKNHFKITPGKFRLVAKSGRIDLDIDSLNTKDSTKLIGMTQKRFEKVNLLILRHEGTFQKIGYTFRKLLDFSLFRGLFSNEPFFYGRSYINPKLDGPFIQRYDIGIETKDLSNIDLPVGFEKLVLKAGNYLSILHRGSVSTIEQTYQTAYLSVLRQKSCSLANASPWEKYHRISPFHEPKNNLIEILFPLEK